MNILTLCDNMFKFCFSQEFLLWYENHDDLTGFTVQYLSVSVKDALVTWHYGFNADV